jgi:hypothetical protein
MNYDDIYDAVFSALESGMDTSTVRDAVTMAMVDYEAAQEDDDEAQHGA